MKLTFDFFQLQFPQSGVCLSDWLKVYDGENGKFLCILSQHMENREWKGSTEKFSQRNTRNSEDKLFRTIYKINNHSYFDED